MNTGEIVYQGKSKKERDFLIRLAKLGDEMKMTEYINTLSKEQTFITFQGEEVSLEEEKGYLDSQLKKMEIQQAVLLLTFSGDQLIGVSGIEMKDKTNSHVGVFGLSVAKDFRGEGIGKVFMQNVIDQAVKNIPTLKIVTLGVFDNNPTALALYKSLGFIEYGNLPKGVLHRGEYVDHIDMYKVVRDF